MFKVSSVALIVAALLPASAFAQSIEGVVKNSFGKPIAGAKVKLEGSSIETIVDTSGRFVFEGLSPGVNELHITAAGFAHLHQDIDVPSAGTKNISFMLKNSPIEVVDIVSTPLHLSSMESALPVSVLSGEALRREQSATIGETLNSLVGVHSSFHAKVASTPIIRGLSGPRVLITQNGLDVSDASRIGPDHAVASEASTATRIEVLRGPATLFYGSGAIGGVVNVVDNRVPTDSETRGEWLVETSTVDDQKLASFNLTTGTDNFAFYADGFVRDSNDYEIPVEAESHEEDHDEHEEHDDHDEHEEHAGNYTVENSAEESYGFTFGGSYLFDDGFVGLSVEKLDRQYGIPGHSHGEEGHEDDDHDDEGHEEEEHDEEHSEENVFADLKQTRVQLLSEFDLQNSFINQIKLRAGLTDYEHAEIEEGQAGTVFENRTQEFRIDALHQPFQEWRGGLSLHYKHSESSAVGEEAFTPPSDTSMLALALMEERHFGDVLLQLGGRIERVTLEANEVLLSSIELHAEGEHEDEHEGDHDEHDDDHDDEHGGESFAFNENYTPISLSAGAVWSFAPEYNVGISVSHSERAPSAAELFSFGPHIGTGTYEVGALFELHEEDDETHIELSNMTIELETSNNIDLTFRKTEGDVGFIFNVFYNSIDNYLYQQDSGLVVHVEAHDHGESDEEEHSDEEHSDEEHSDEEHSDEESSELPLFVFNQQDVVLNGFEAQIAWQVNSTFKTEVFADFVRARLKDGGNLPQTSPMRFGTKLSYKNTQLSAHLNITRYQSQEHTAEYESSTNGYTMLDLNVSYDIPAYNMAVYFKGNNLTDTEARVHTSYLKNLAPRPGRNLSLGIKGYF
jgi:iron complex outermembrane receptor protein